MFLYRLFSDQTLLGVNIDFLSTAYSKQAENVHIISIILLECSNSQSSL